VRLFILSALAVIAFVATMAVHTTPANAVIYCKTVGVPPGCVVRGATPVARAVVRPGTHANRGGRRIGSETKLCPVVQFGSDGSITSIIACELGSVQKQ